MLTRGRPAGHTDEDGFTLVELILSIGLLGLIFSTLSLVMLSSVRVNDDTEERLDRTRDEQFVAAYFASDMAGATQVLPGGASQCGAGPAVVNLLGESFVPTTSGSATPSATTTVATYVLATATVDGVPTGTLTRRFCEGTGNPPFATPTETTTLASRLATTAPVVTCFTGTATAACSSATTTISVAFDRLGGGRFTLSGTRRTTP